MKGAVIFLILIAVVLLVVGRHISDDDRSTLDRLPELSPFVVPEPTYNLPPYSPVPLPTPDRIIPSYTTITIPTPTTKTKPTPSPTPTFTITPILPPTTSPTPSPPLDIKYIEIPTLPPLPTIPTLPTVEPPPTKDQYEPCTGATAICNDGWCSHSKSCSGTCSRHGGVQTWLIYGLAIGCGS